MSKPKNIDTITTESLEDCIRVLSKHGIKLVVFDMDLTAVAAHSRGQLVRSNLDDYISKATPAFLALVPKLHEKNFHLALATHSDEAEFGGDVQPSTHILGNELARTLVEKSFHPSVASSFFIVAYNPRVHPEENPEKNQIKRYHMRKLQEHFSLKAHEIVFFDDTADVVTDCREICGVQAFPVNPEFGFQIEDLLKGLR